MKALAWVALLAIGAATCLAWLHQPSLVDDAMIFLRYARNLVEGHGWVYNHGDWVNGTTSTTNPILLALVSWISGGRYELAQIVLFGLGVGAAGSLTFSLFKSLGTVPAAIACISVMSMPYLYWLIGMETPLVLGFAVGATWCYANGRFLLCSTLLAALCLSRADGVVLAVALAAHYLWNRPQERWREFVQGLLLFVTPLLAWAAFSWFAFGAFLPKTAGAKLAQSESGLLGEGWVFVDNMLDNLSNFANIRLGEPWHEVWKIAFCSLGAIGCAIALARRHASWPLIVFGFGQAALYTLLNAPNYLWYYVPFGLALTLGLATVISMLWRLRAPGRAIALALALGFLHPLVPRFWIVRDTNDLHYKSASNYPHYLKVAEILRQRVPEGASIACSEIGVIGYELRNWRIIDMWGLVTRGGVEAIKRGDFAWWFRDTEPEFVLFHAGKEGAWEGPEAAVAAMPEFHAKYEPFLHRNDFGKPLLVMRRKPKKQ